MELTSGKNRPDERVLVIGLDGATWTNLLPRVNNGEMPVLQKLVREGASGVLNSTIPALTPPAWASLVTGTNPGKHGIYHFRNTPGGTYYQLRLNTSRDVAAPPVWLRIGQAGKSVGVINVPLCSPVYPVNGFITTDAFAPNVHLLKVHPPELQEQFGSVAADISNYPTALPGTKNYLKQMLAFVDENERVLVQQADAAVKMMRNLPWQFFMVVWLILDRLQHFAWKFCEAGAETTLSDPDDKQIAARCARSFKLIDAQIGRLIEAAGANGSVILASDHGFGPVASHFFHANRWLELNGYLKLLPAWHWRRWALSNFPRAWRARWKLPLDSKFGKVDWQRTRVWADCLEARAVGLRINRKGRFPQGIVTESEYRPLKEQLLSDLRKLESPPGQKVFREFHDAETLYHGSHANAAPDIVAVLEQPFDGPPSFRRDLSSTDFVNPNRNILRDGGHEPEGIVVLSGPSIRHVPQLAPQEIVNIAPTVLRLLRIPVSDGLDGQAIAAAIIEELLENPAAAPAASPAATATSANQPEYSDEDSSQVEERLRNLGYLD